MLGRLTLFDTDPGGWPELGPGNESCFLISITGTASSGVENYLELPASSNPGWIKAESQHLYKKHLLLCQAAPYFYLVCSI